MIENNYSKKKKMYIYAGKILVSLFIFLSSPDKKYCFTAIENKYFPLFKIIIGV